MTGQQVTLAEAAACEALELRDEALAALDGGDPETAVVFAREALAVLDSARLRGGLDEAAVLIALAEIEECASRFDAAAATTARAIGIVDSQASDGDADSVMLWGQAHERLAGLLRMAGEFDSAASMLNTVLDRVSAVFGEASLPVVTAASALGVVYKYSSDFDAAQAAYDRARSALGELPDPEPHLEAGLLHNLGGLAHSRGDAATGIPIAEQGLALREITAGPDHPDVARDLNALGALYHLADRWDDAEQAYRRALRIFEENYGPEHYEVGMTCANLAVLHGDQGRNAQAEQVGRRSLRILGVVLGPEDAEVGLTLLNLAAAVEGQGRHAEAADMTARAAAILSARLPSSHPHVLAVTEALERCRVKQ